MAGANLNAQTNNRPLPDFAASIPIPVTQASMDHSTMGLGLGLSSNGAGPGNGTQPRNSSKNSSSNEHGQHGIFNPIRRTFVIPVPPTDSDVRDAVRDAAAILRSKMKRPRALAETNHTNNIGNSSTQAGMDPSYAAAVAAATKEREILEETFKSLKQQSKEAKLLQSQKQESVELAQKKLVQIIRDRDQELKAVDSNAKDNASTGELSENLQAKYAENEELQALITKKQQLEKQTKESEEKLVSLEEQWKKEDAENVIKLRKEREEEEARKRKAADELEEEIKKKQKLCREEETAELKKLEDDLKGKQTQLDALNQTKSQMIWLLKEVILAGKKNKKTNTATSASGSGGAPSGSGMVGSSAGSGSLSMDVTRK